jgi:GntR family transcriptional regulator
MEQPLYLCIAGHLRNSIISGGYKPEDMLPSENELAASYGTSRQTARKSLAVLESEGLIKAQHGKGYFVLPPKHTLFSLVFGDNTTEGRFRFQEVNLVSPYPEVAGMLSLRENQMAIVTRRLLERYGEPLAYDEKFIPYERGVPSVELEIHFAEFPDMFADRFSPTSLRTEMTIGVEKAPAHVCSALLTDPGTPLLVISRLILTDRNQAVGYGKQYLREEYGKLTARSGYYQTERF